MGRDFSSSGLSDLVELTPMLLREVKELIRQPLPLLGGVSKNQQFLGHRDKSWVQIGGMAIAVIEEQLLTNWLTLCFC